MWTRAELKKDAKSQLKKNYWKSVLVGIILTFLLGSGATSTGHQASEELTNMDFLNGIDPATLLWALGLVLGAVAIGLLINLLCTIFLWNPLDVGCRKYFLETGEQESVSLKTLGYAFKNGYGHIGGVMFVKTIYVMLWSCLFIIPGIVKSYEYMMVPYILAENPDMSRKEVLDLSRKMMKGNKWNAFVLDLSFIGWQILSVFTLGILNVLFVAPYTYHTQANLYRTLKNM